MLTPRRSSIFTVLVLLIPVLLVAWIVLGNLPRRAPHPTPPAPPPSRATTPRIVALSPALAIDLRELGLENAIVGRHAFDLILDKSIPVCGDQSGINYEALITVNPTDVLLEWGSRPLPSRLTEMALERHWNLHSYRLLSLQDVEDCILDLRKRFPPTVDSQPTEQALLERMARAWGKREGLFTGRVLLLGALDPPAALGPGSFHHEILTRIGGVPAIGGADGGPYMTRSAEDILRLAPDGIILILPRDPKSPPRAAHGAGTDGGSAVALLGRLATLDIPAVHSGQVALIDDPLALTPSTAMLDVADEMARILAEWEKP